MERKEPSRTAGGNANGCSRGGRQSEAPQKKPEKQNHHMISDSTTEDLPRTRKTLLRKLQSWQRHLPQPSVDQPKGAGTDEWIKMGARR